MPINKTLRPVNKKRPNDPNREKTAAEKIFKQQVWILNRKFIYIEEIILKFKVTSGNLSLKDKDDYIDPPYNTGK